MVPAEHEMLKLSIIGNNPCVTISLSGVPLISKQKLNIKDLVNNDKII